MSGSIFGPIPSNFVIPVTPIGFSASAVGTLTVVTELPAVIPIWWRPEKLNAGAVPPDGYANEPISDPALASITAIRVGFCTCRLAVCWGSQPAVTFPPAPHEMTPDDLASQARGNGNFPAGTIPNKDIGV